MPAPAVLVELDQEGYVVCHWPLSYGLFEAEGVEVVLDAALDVMLLVERANVGVYEADEEAVL